MENTFNRLSLRARLAWGIGTVMAVMLLANLAADLGYAALDPRVSLERVAA